MFFVTAWVLAAAGALADAQTYSYSYTTEAPTVAPTASLAPTRSETYAPTRFTEAPSYAPTTETYAPTQTPTQRHGSRRHRGYTTTGMSEVDSEESFNNQSRSGSFSQGTSNGAAATSHVVAAAPSANARTSAADSDDSFNAGAAPGPSGRWRAGPK